MNVLCDCETGLNRHKYYINLHRLVGIKAVPCEICWARPGAKRYWQQPMNALNHDTKQLALVAAGAVLGGLLGYMIFFAMVHEGFYGLVAPGGFLGLGAGIGRSRQVWVAWVCGLLALFLGIFCEWRFEPFIADQSLSYFFEHLQDLRPVSLIMILAGAAIGFYVPFRRRY